MFTVNQSHGFTLGVSLPPCGACAHTYTNSWISTATHTQNYIHNSCANEYTHTNRGTQSGVHKKSTSLIQSSVFASDGGLINVATLQLFIISVTSNLQSDMIGLMYDALVSCGWLLRCGAKGKECSAFGQYESIPKSAAFSFFPHLSI